MRPRLLGGSSRKGGVEGWDEFDGRRGGVGENGKAGVDGARIGVRVVRGSG